MRMKRKTGSVIRRICGLKMIEKQKGIEIVKRMAADTPLQSNARALDDILRFDNFSDFSRWRRHHLPPGICSSSSAEKFTHDSEQRLDGKTWKHSSA
jgi:hypothetical protein